MSQIKLKKLVLEWIFPHHRTLSVKISKTRNTSKRLTDWPDLYWRRIIRLGRAWAKNGSLSDPSVYNTGKQTDRPSTRAIAIICLGRRTIEDNSSKRMIRLYVFVCKCGQKTNYPRKLHLVTRSQRLFSINYQFKLADKSKDGSVKPKKSKKDRVWIDRNRNHHPFLKAASSQFR